MHHLPFGAKMTEKLFRVAQAGARKTQDLFRLAQASDARPSETDCVCGIEWAPLLLESFAVPGSLCREGWCLSHVPKNHSEPERIFVVDGVSFHISPGVEPLLRNQILDWDDDKGVIAHAA